MSNSKHFISLVFLLLPLIIYSQTTFKTQLDFSVDLGNQFNINVNLIELDNGNLIVNGGGSDQSLIAEIQSDGTPLWAKTIEDDLGGILESTSLTNLHDGGFLLTAVGTDHRFYKLLRFNNQSELQWARFVGRGNEANGSTIQTQDKGFALVGNTKEDTFGNTDIFFAKIDSLGNVAWAKNYGTEDWERGYAAHELDNGDFMILHQGTFKTMVIRLTSSGEVLFAKSYEGGGLGTGMDAMIQLTDGNFLYRGSDGTGSFRPVVVKINEMGEILWSKRSLVTGSESILRMNACSDGGFITQGIGLDQMNQNDRLVVSKFTTDGALVWAHAIDEKQGICRFIKETADGAFVNVTEKQELDSLVLIKIANDGSICNGMVTGFLPLLVDFNISVENVDLMTGDGFSQGDNAITFFDVDINENQECLMSETENVKMLNNQFKVVPNPVSDQLFLHFSQGFENQKAFEFFIYNRDGVLIKTGQKSSLLLNESIDVADLQSGFYILEVLMDGVAYYQKFVK